MRQAIYYLNQWWLVYRRKYASLVLNELNCEMILSLLWTCFFLAGTGVQQAESSSKVNFMFFTSFVNSKELAKSETDDTMAQHYMDTTVHFTHEQRILMSCINVFQGQIKSFIDIWNCLNS